MGRVVTEAGSVTEVSYPSAVSTAVTQVNAASVAAGEYSVIDATATNGKRWALISVKCNKSHGADFWGHSADFAAITAAKKLRGYTSSGVADNSASGGDSYLVPCAGYAFIAARVHNEDGAAAATITVIVESLFN